jgi:ABC-type Mn2+/Zn2+ transport system ATPase subunit
MNPMMASDDTPASYSSAGNAFHHVASTNCEDSVDYTLGPNGVGKTTLTPAILGLIVPAAGSVHVFGEPPRRDNPAIGYVPQSAPSSLACGCAALISLRVRCKANAGAFALVGQLL